MPGSFYNMRRHFPEALGGRSWEPADIGNDAVKEMIGRSGWRKGFSPAKERQWQQEHAFSDDPIETQELMKRLGVTDYVGEPVASPYTGIMSDDPSHPQKQPYGNVVMPPPSRQTSPSLDERIGGFLDKVTGKEVTNPDGTPLTPPMQTPPADVPTPPLEKTLEQRVWERDQQKRVPDKWGRLYPDKNDPDFLDPRITKEGFKTMQYIPELDDPNWTPWGGRSTLSDRLSPLGGGEGIQYRL